jgi:hypothetical protein
MKLRCEISTFSLRLSFALFLFPYLAYGQEVPSLIPSLDRGYMADDNSFVALQNTDGLNFQAQVLTWTPEGLEEAGEFSIVNQSAGQYTVLSEGDVIARLARGQNLNGQTYWQLNSAPANSSQAWNFGGLQGYTNQTDQTASFLLRSWERRPGGLVSLEQLSAFAEAFPEAISTLDSGGAIVRSQETGLLASYLRTIGREPEVRTSVDFAGNSIAAVPLRPTEVLSMVALAQPTPESSFVSLSSANFYLPSFQAIVLKKPNIFEPFLSGTPLKENDRAVFIENFSSIVKSRGCKIATDPNGATGAGVLTCEFHSHEYRIGRRIWALMYFRFRVVETQSGDIDVTYMISFRFEKGSFNDPPQYPTEYRDEADFDTDREANSLKRHAQNLVSIALSFL